MGGAGTFTDLLRQEVFAGLLRQEQRAVRDPLLVVAEAFVGRGPTGARALLAEAAALIGPNFPYEWESPHRSLVDVLVDLTTGAGGIIRNRPA